MALGACDRGGTTATTPEGVAVDENALKEALKKEFNFAPGDTKVYVAPPVPGLLVFSARAEGKRPGRVTGVFDGHTIERDFETNFRRVLTALGLDRDQSVPALIVAQTVGLLEDDPGNPVVDADTLPLMRQDLGLFLPRYTTVDGLTAVEYWNTSARMAPWHTTIVVRADGTYEYRRG
jgi:hypothetical protein